jgi:hypothetical protein
MLKFTRLQISFAEDFRRDTMNRFLIACFAATGYCGLAATAHANPVQNASQPISVTANTTQQNGGMPYMLSELQNEIRMLQTNVQTLSSLEGQAPENPRYVISAAPPPNPDSALIPSGG